MSSNTLLRFDAATVGPGSNLVLEAPSTKPRAIARKPWSAREVTVIDEGTLKPMEQKTTDGLRIVRAQSGPSRAMESEGLSRSPLPRDEFRRQHQEFLARIASPSGFEMLFDYLADVYFFVKDRTGRFMRCNDAFLTLVHARAEEDVLGQCDADFFPSALADSYVRDDHLVMDSATTIIDKIELVRNAEGSINWYSTTKLPVLDANGEAIGVAGVTRDISKMKSNSERFSYWAPVLETITANYAEPLSMAALAAKVSLSVSQFDRRFKQRFRTTPLKYLTNVRINAACQLLASTDAPVAAIAVQVGFYDQSHFTKQFAKLKGTTPAQYRRNHRRIHAAGL